MDFLNKLLGDVNWGFAGAVKACIARADAHFNKKEYDAAIAEYNQVIQRGVVLVPVYLNRGLAYYLDFAHQAA